MRTIIELPPDQIDALDALCRRDRISRAEAIRRAVAGYVRSVPREGADPAYGLWRARRIDGLKYQNRLRREWD